MKKKSIIILAVVAVMVILVISVIGSLVGAYNDFVEDREELNAAQAEIDSQVLRRADLIPNFVSTVKGYSDYEQETYTAVTNARAAYLQSNSTSAGAQASQELDRAIDIWVNAVTEAYPELKANEQYIALQDELAGTENRIAIARRDYNEEAREYNTEIKKFPNSLLARLFGFEEATYFEVDSSAQSVPQVSFD